MERNELIIRVRDDKDRRVVWIEVTDKGQAETERGTRIKRDIIEQSLDNISAHNQQLLVYLLGKVASSS